MTRQLVEGRQERSAQHKKLMEARKDNIRVLFDIRTALCAGSSSMRNKDLDQQGQAKMAHVSTNNCSIVAHRHRRSDSLTDSNSLNCDFSLYRTTSNCTHALSFHQNQQVSICSLLSAKNQGICPIIVKVAFVVGKSILMPT